MQLELHRDPSIFETWRTAWNALLPRSVSPVPFLRSEYQQTWWTHRGGGEWPQAELLVLGARDPAGQLAGVAPLFWTPQPESPPALMFIGSAAVSDYLDLLVSPPQVEAFCTALLERLTQPDLPGWGSLDLCNLPAASPTRGALQRAAAARGWRLTEQTLPDPTPVIPLPETWEAYLEMMDKKERHELKRKLRRVSGAEAPVTWRMVTGGEHLAAEAETFMRLMACDPAKARFLTPAMRAQFTELIGAAGQNGWLQLAFLEVDHAPAAAYLNFDFNNRVWVYNSGLEPRFNSLSAGWVLLGYLIQWAIENKRAAFDFMRGSEDYKYRFGAVAEPLYRLQISR